MSPAGIRAVELQTALPGKSLRPETSCRPNKDRIRPSVYNTVRNSTGRGHSRTGMTQTRRCSRPALPDDCGERCKGEMVFDQYTPLATGDALAPGIGDPLNMPQPTYGPGWTCRECGWTEADNKE